MNTDVMCFKLDSESCVLMFLQEPMFLIFAVLISCVIIHIEAILMCVCTHGECRLKETKLEDIVTLSV
jgi:hypothetical protein